MANTQYTFRAQRASGLAEGPLWEVTSQIPEGTSAVRCSAYSKDGEWFAYAMASSVQLLPSSSSSTAPVKTIELPNVVALGFSPLSSYLFTFERPVKSDTELHKNVKAWDVMTGEEVGGWYQKNQDDWAPIITPDEAHALRPTASDLLIFTPPLSARPVTRLKLDGNIKGVYLSNPSSLSPDTTSAKPLPPHSEPAVAIWVGERQGAPANIGLHQLSSLLGKTPQPVDGEEKTETRDIPISTARKAFYKADKLSVKWNPAGTMALFLSQSDVDTTGKSYYGETNLYLVSVDGSFDGMVELDKEGPIHDFAWNPTSRDFAVCYGYMPAQVQLFNTKAKSIHSFGAQHRNVILYQPQGRLLLTAGFGNLAGGVDIWDVSTRVRVAEFRASNSSHCEWSACGRYILTATLSPRLRVDNGVKIWWCGGQCLHIHPQDDLYQAAFRPRKLANVEAFPPVIPKAPEASPNVALYRPKGEAENGGDSKPAGAYRPPGARGTTASDAYRRDATSTPSSGTATPTPMFPGGKPAERYRPATAVPGAPPPGAKEDRKKRVRSKRPLKDNIEAPEANGETPAEEMEQLHVDGADAATDGPEVEEALQKKIRNLVKKLKAIEDLKERKRNGEQLEKTQLKKIESQKQVQAEVDALGGAH